MNISAKHTGGIVVAVSLAIVAASVAIMLVLLSQNVDFAVLYTENDTDLLLGDVDAHTALFAEEHGALGEPGARGQQLRETYGNDGAEAVSRAMAACLDETEQAAVYFAQDGRKLFEAGQVPPGADVFEAFPRLEELRAELKPDKTQRWLVWENLDGLFPHDQKLYEVRYSDEFGAYLLCVNPGTMIFAEARQRSTTFLLVILVVMILLVLLVVAGVRWYRSQLMRLAATDELTGLANRKSFTERFEGTFQREGVGRASLALVDADHFKQVNDTYGHAAGDEVLSVIAAEVQAAVAPGGLSGRWGGDEFIGVFFGTPEECRKRGNEMIDRITSIELTNGFRPSVSVGMTEVDPSLPLERIVDQADEALYVTKDGGRGFLTVYDPAVMTRASHEEVPDARRPVDLLERVDVEDEPQSGGAERSDDAHARGRLRLGQVMKSLMDAVRMMIPFVAGGGILVAVAFLFDAASVDVNSLSPEMRASFGSITPIAAGLHEVGLAAFNFMLPIFAAFFARGLAGNKAFMAGFAGGFLSSQGSAGFVGAICTALISALVVRLLDTFFHGMPGLVRRVASVLIIPVFSLLVMYFFMVIVINPVAGLLDGLLASMLASLLGGSRVVLGAVLGAMMSTDMGGFINKAAYHFGTASIAEGSPDIMAAVMVGGMVAPCGIALSMLLFRHRFTTEEYDLAPTTFVLGLSFITEGALPFVLTDFARIIPSCMAGSALAGALSEAFGCTLMAPHGGICVFPVVGNPLLYLVSLAAGSLLCALLLGFLKGVGAKGAGEAPADGSGSMAEPVGE